MLTFREWVHYYKEIDELEFNWNAIYTKTGINLLFLIAKWKIAAIKQDTSKKFSDNNY